MDLRPATAAQQRPARRPRHRLRQSEFIALPYAAWHGDFGYLYLPKSCEDSAGAGCRLHVAFHGCLQDIDSIGATFIAMPATTPGPTATA
jgi:hypothetical protein